MSVAEKNSSKSQSVPGYVDFDEYIEYQVNKARTHIRSNDLLTAITGGLAIILGYLLLFVVFDHWVIPEGFGFYSRITLLGAALGIAGFWFYYRMRNPYFHKINKLYAAHELESAQPEFQNNLLSLIDLQEHGKQVSPEIVESMRKRAAVKLEHMDVDQAIDRKSLMRSSYILLSVVVIFCVYSLISPKKISTSIQRALFPAGNIQAPTQTEIVEVLPGNVELLARSQLEVTTTILGVTPDEVLLKYTTADQRHVDESIVMSPSPEGNGRYTGLLTGENGKGLLQNVTYYISAGDDQSEKYQITIRQPPSAKIISAQINPPAYTKLPAQENLTGEIDGYEGSTVTLTAEANTVLTRAVVRFSDDQDLTKKAEEVTMTISEGTKLSATWNLRIRGDGTFPRFYHISCRNSADETDPNPQLYAVNIRPDLPPEVVVHEPSGDLEVPANAVIPIIFGARDPDFALKSVILRVEKLNENIHSETLFEGEQPALEGKHRLDLERLRLKAGDIITWYLQSYDNRMPAANRKNTKKYVIKIMEPVSTEEVKNRLDQMEKDQQQKIRQPDQGNQQNKQDKNDPAQNMQNNPNDKMNQEPANQQQNDNPSNEDKPENKEKDPATSKFNNSNNQQGEKSKDKFEIKDKNSENKNNQIEQKPEVAPDGSEDDLALQKLMEKIKNKPQQNPAENQPQNKPDSKKNDQGNSEQDNSENKKPEDGSQMNQPQNQTNDSQKNENENGSQNKTDKNNSSKNESGKPNAGKNSDAGNQMNQENSQDQNSSNKNNSKNSDQVKNENDSPKAGSNSEEGTESGKPSPLNKNSMQEKTDSPDNKNKSTTDKTETGKPNPNQGANQDKTTGQNPNQQNSENNSSNKQDTNSNKEDSNNEKNSADNMKNSPDGNSRKEDSKGKESATGEMQNSQEQSNNPQQNSNEKPGEKLDQNNSSSNDKNKNNTSENKGNNQNPSENMKQNSPEEKGADPNSKPADKDQNSQTDQNKSNKNDGSNKMQQTENSNEVNPDQKSNEKLKPGELPDKIKPQENSSNDENTQQMPAKPGQVPENAQPQLKKEGADAPASQDKSDDKNAADKPGENNKDQLSSNKKGNDDPSQKMNSENKQSEDNKNGDNKSGKQNDPQQSPKGEGKQPEEKPGAGNKPGEKPGTGNKPGEKPGEGNMPGNNPGKPSDNRGNNSGQGASNTDSKQNPEHPMSKNVGTGGDRHGDLPANPGDLNFNEEMTPAEAKELKDKKQAAELVLKELENQINDGDVDPELLKELGWTEDQLKKFQERLSKFLSKKPGELTPEEQQQKAQFDEMLKQMNFSNKEAVEPTGSQQEKRDVSGFAPGRGQAPAQYREQEKAYERSLSSKREKTGK